MDVLIAYSISCSRSMCLVFLSCFLLVLLQLMRATKLRFRHKRPQVIRINLFVSLYPNPQRGGKL